MAQKLILNSIIAILILVPALAARDPDPRLALRKALIGVAIGICFYELLLLFVYPRFLG